MQTDHLDECPLCRRAADLDDDGVPVGRKEYDLYTREDWAALVRLRVVFPAASGRHWPDLTVAPRIDGAAGCRYDAALKRCSLS